jgi:hypothetical protein
VTDRQEATNTPSTGQAAQEGDVLPYLAEMDGRSVDLAQSRRDIVELRTLGESASGRPIHLLSVGEGPRSALIVGAPHPNEPIGCVTIERLIDTLVANPDLRTTLGYRWHFIKAIDPDGVALNEGWFRRPRTPATYLRNFFRPALRDQPEYSFPLEVPAYKFTASTPENICWQKALELTRPHLLCSLHNGDVTGAFFVTSRHVPSLTEALARIPGEFGMPLSMTGEPFSEMAVHGPGVFDFPRLSSMLTNAARFRSTVSEIWNAGRSSAEYAEEHFGTFSMTCEVPFWDDIRLRSNAMSGSSFKDIVERMITSNEGLQVFLARRLPHFYSIARDRPEQALFDALKDAERSATLQNKRLRRLLKLMPLQRLLDVLSFSRLKISPVSNGPMPLAQYADIDLTLRLASLRPWGMVLHLCDRVSDRSTSESIAETAAEASSHLDARVADLEREAPLTAWPLSTPVMVQMRAIVETARTLSAA